MAKKKKTAKKKTSKKKVTKKKTPKKKTKKLDPLGQLRSNRELSTLDMRVILEAKRLKVKELLPEIPCTGREELGEGDDKETIPYTEAEVVREMYFAAFAEVGLSVSSHAEPGMMPAIAQSGKLLSVAGAFQITDTQTGYSVIGWGVGQGINYDWAANTAVTRAMKQFLLHSFMANWKDPLRNEIAREVRHFKAGEFVDLMKSAKETVEEMSEFYGQKIPQQNQKGGKPKKD